MKRLLVGLALFAAACGGTNPSAPTGVQNSSQTSQVTPTPAGPSGSGPTVDPTPGGPNANAATPQYTFSGPRNAQNCFTNVTDVMQWVLTVTDAGPRALRFIAMAHQDETPGCEATAKNPRARVEMTGVTNYTPHSSGQTTFIYRPEMYNCGRVQVDVSIFDASGNEILVLGTVINYGTTCTPQQPALACVASPSNPAVPLPGSALTFNVVNPVAGAVYTWSAPGATPAVGTGTSFTTQFNSPTPGTLYQITPSGPTGAATTPCTVIFPTLTTTVCAPAPTNPAPVPGQPWTGTFNVINPLSGVTYTWTATGGNPASGSGLSFPVTFPANAGATPVTYNVQLAGNGANLVSTGCTVTMPPPLPQGAFCSPSPSNPAPVPGQPWSGTFVVTNPQTGRNYSWSTATGAPSTAAGLSFSVTFPANLTGSSVAHSVQLSDTVSGPLPSGTCVVTLPPPPPPTPAVCAPAPTNPVPTAGQPWTGTFSVQNPQAGQTYSWAATGGSPATGTGTSFTVSYPANLTAAPVTYNVQMSANGVPQTSTACTVTLPPPPPPTPAVCAPAPTNPAPAAGQPWTGTYVAQNAQAGQTYSWAATGGNPASGTGTSFTVSYPANLTAAPVTYNVQLSANGVPQTSTACTVTLPPSPPPTPAVCAPAAGNPVPAIGQPWTGTFNVQNAQAGQTYSWAATGGTPSSGTGLTFPVTFPANLTGAPVTYSVQLSSNGSPLTSTACTVTQPPVPAPICAPAGVQTVQAGTVVPFSVSNAVTGITYTWAISPVGGTPVATGPNGTTFSASFAAPTPPAQTITYSITPSIAGGAAGAACQVSVPAPPLQFSCAGTTARIIEPLAAPTGSVIVVVPPNQRANIQLDSTDHTTDIVTIHRFVVGPGTTTLTIPVACFPKIDVYCGPPPTPSVLLDSVRGEPQCTP